MAQCRWSNGKRDHGACREVRSQDSWTTGHGSSRTPTAFREQTRMSSLSPWTSTPPLGAERISSTYFTTTIAERYPERHYVMAYSL